MNATQDLQADAALRKLRDLIDATPTCMFASRLQEIPFHVCPMQVQEVDDRGALWLFSRADSAHNDHIARDPRVQLIFANDSVDEYLTVFGLATVSRSLAMVERLWTPAVDEWFPQGQDDPNLTLLKIEPAEAHYWDTRDGKLVSLAKILTSAFTGRPFDGGVQGGLRVHA